MRKDWWFEELGPDENLWVEVSLDYSYYYDGGKLYGDDAYPPEEDGEINLPDDLLAVIQKSMPNEQLSVCMMVMAEIEGRVLALNADIQTVKEWYDEECEDDHECDID